jgi:hypothetical protein
MVGDGWGVGGEGAEPTTCAITTSCLEERIKQMKMCKKEAGLDMLMGVSNVKRGRMECVDERSAR